LSNLPSRVSDLIRLAIKDLEVCEADPLYEIDLSYWHMYDQKNKVCLVCLAGALMAKSLGVEYKENRYPTGEVEPQLRLIDAIREYVQYPDRESWDGVLGILDDDFSFRYDLDDIPSPLLFAGMFYDDDPKAFKSSLLMVASHFDQLDVHYIRDN